MCGVDLNVLVFFMVLGILITLVAVKHGSYQIDYKEKIYKKMESPLKHYGRMFVVWLDLSFISYLFIYIPWSNSFPFVIDGWGPEPYLWLIFSIFTTWLFYDPLLYVLNIAEVSDKRKALINEQEYKVSKEAGREPKFKYWDSVWDKGGHEYEVPVGVNPDNFGFATSSEYEKWRKPLDEIREKERRAYQEAQISRERWFRERAVKEREWEAKDNEWKLKRADKKIQEAEYELEKSIKDWSKGDGIFATKEQKKRSVEAARKRLKEKMEDKESLRKELYGQ